MMMWHNDLQPDLASLLGEMNLKLDKKFLPLDYPQFLYQKFLTLHQHVDQSMAEYTEQSNKLLSRVNMEESDDQLVARYVSGLRYYFKRN